MERTMLPILEQEPELQRTEMNSYHQKEFRLSLSDLETKNTSNVDKPLTLECSQKEQNGLYFLF